MAHIYAFDNRTGAVNEQVTLGTRQRKAPLSSVEGFRRHPRIDWQAGTLTSAPVPPPKQTRPVPASEVERLQRYGGVRGGGHDVGRGATERPGGARGVSRAERRGV